MNKAHIVIHTHESSPGWLLKLTQANHLQPWNKAHIVIHTHESSPGWLLKLTQALIICSLVIVCSSDRDDLGLRTVIESLYGVAMRRRLKTIDAGWLAR